MKHEGGMLVRGLKGQIPLYPLALFFSCSYILPSRHFALLHGAAYRFKPRNSYSGYRRCYPNQSDHLHSTSPPTLATMSDDMHYRRIRSRGVSPSPREESHIPRRNPLARRRSSIRKSIDDVAIYDEDLLFDDYPGGATPQKQNYIVASPARALTVRRPSELEKFNVFNVGGEDRRGRSSESSSYRGRTRSRSRSRSRVRFEKPKERPAPVLVKRYHVPRIPDSRIFDMDDDDHDSFFEDDEDDWDEEEEEEEDETDSVFFSSEDGRSAGNKGGRHADIAVNVKASMGGPRPRSRRRSTQSETLPMASWPKEAFRRREKWDTGGMVWDEEVERVGVREVSGRRVRRKATEEWKPLNGFRRG